MPCLHTVAVSIASIKSRAQKPVIRIAAVKAASVETIIVETGAHLAGEREGAICRRGTVDRLHHKDAVRGRVGAGAVRTRDDVQKGVTDGLGRAVDSGRAAVDHELVG
jgi:hypothetical protein